MQLHWPLDCSLFDNQSFFLFITIFLCLCSEAAPLGTRLNSYPQNRLLCHVGGYTSEFEFLFGYFGVRLDLQINRATPPQRASVCPYIYLKFIPRAPATHKPGQPEAPQKNHGSSIGCWRDKSGLASKCRAREGGACRRPSPCLQAGILALHSAFSTTAAGSAASGSAASGSAFFCAQ